MRNEIFGLGRPLIGEAEQHELDTLHTKRSGLPLLILMEQAAAAVFHFLRVRFRLERESVLILCGPGNNGGDGWALARQLLSVCADLTVADFAPERVLTEEAEQMRQAARNLNLNILNIQSEDDTKKLPRTGLIVDCLLGTGFTVQRGLDPVMKGASRIISAYRSEGSGVISVDIPSGVDSNNGNCDPLAVSADFTPSFMYKKKGIALIQGAQKAGEIVLLPIGLPESAEQLYPVREITYEMVRELLPKRRPDSHKGTYGYAVLCAGSEQMPGAMFLAAEAALRSGVGYLHLVSAAPVLQSALTLYPECLQTDESKSELLKELLLQEKTVAAGPGWGRGKEDLLKTLFDSGRDLILDADALNQLARTGCTAELLRERAERIGAGRTLLTPHPGEFRRLFPEIAERHAQDAFSMAAEAATTARCLMLLKGSHSILAFPDGRILIHTKACSGLARAGSGDVLTGLILGLSAQSLSLAEAATVGMYVHNAAAGRLSEKDSETVMRVGELAQTFAQVFSCLHESTVI